MYEAQLEFPDGWGGGGGGLRKNPFRGGGMDNLWNFTLSYILNFTLLFFLSNRTLCGYQHESFGNQVKLFLLICSVMNNIHVH